MHSVFTHNINVLSIDNTIASCLIPEIPNSEEVEEDLIENKYNAGSIVWGYIKKYLWWPAIIDDCPTTFRYYELRESSDIPVRHIMHLLCII